MTNRAGILADLQKVLVAHKPKNRADQEEGIEALALALAGAFASTHNLPCNDETFIGLAMAATEAMEGYSASRSN